VKLQLRTFTGMRPASAVDLLKPGEAASAINTSFSGGDLEPLNALSAAVVTLTSVLELKTIYRFGQSNTNEAQYWFQADTDANFVKGPLDGDTEETTYFTGTSAGPSKTRASVATTGSPYPSTVYKMGLPKPNTPTVVLSGTATDPQSTPETVAYVVTLVSQWGEESEPSAPSALVTWRAGQTITVTSQTSGSGSYLLSTGAKKRIYRSATGTSGSAKYLLVNTDDALAITTADYADTKATSALGEALRSKNWTEPRSDMFGLVQMANGIMAGFSGNTVCFSEPFVPHAWPRKYEQSVDATIVGGAVFDQSLLVATKRSLYLFTGSDPAQLTSERLAITQTCVSKRSMVEMNGGVVFACPDGLAYIGPGGFKLLSDGLLTRSQWQAYKPDSMHAYNTDTDYVVFYDTGTVKKGLLFSFGTEMSFCELDFYATAGFRDRGRDALYLCVNGTGSNREIRKWDAGSALSMTWESGEFRLEAPVNMSVARVETVGAVNFELLADGSVVYGPTSISGRQAFKLPADYRATRFRVRVSGTGRVRSIELADSMRSLADG
jgi:hypothetical protein